MDIKFNKETKTVDFRDGETIVLQVTPEELAKYGIPVDTKDPDNVIVELKGLTAEVVDFEEIAKPVIPATPQMVKLSLDGVALAGFKIP